MHKKKPLRLAGWWRSRFAVWESWQAAISFGNAFPRDEKYLAQLREFEATFSYPKLQERKRKKKPGQTPRHEKVVLRLPYRAYRRR